MSLQTPLRGLERFLWALLEESYPIVPKNGRRCNALRKRLKVFLHAVEVSGISPCSLLANYFNQLDESDEIKRRFHEVARMERARIDISIFQVQTHLDWLQRSARRTYRRLDAIPKCLLRSKRLSIEKMIELTREYVFHASEMEVAMASLRFMLETSKSPLLVSLAPLLGNYEETIQLLRGTVDRLKGEKVIDDLENVGIAYELYIANQVALLTKQDTGIFPTIHVRHYDKFRPPPSPDNSLLAIFVDSKPKALQKTFVKGDLDVILARYHESLGWMALRVIECKVSFSGIVKDLVRFSNASEILLEERTVDLGGGLIVRFDQGTSFEYVFSRCRRGESFWRTLKMSIRLEDTTDRELIQGLTFLSQCRLWRRKYSTYKNESIRGNGKGGVTQ